MALALNPHDSDLLGDLGYSYLLQNRFAESEQYSSRAVQANPKNQKAIKHLGDAYARQGKTQQAEETYARVMPANEIQAALAENAPGPAPMPTANTPASTKDQKSLLDRLLPNRQSEEEKFLAEVQKAREQERLNTNAHPAPPAMPRRERRPQEDVLKDQLAAIDREPYQQAHGGALLLDGQTGQMTPISEQEIPRHWANSHGANSHGANPQFANPPGALVAQPQPAGGAPAPAALAHFESSSPRPAPVAPAVSEQPARGPFSEPARSDSPLQQPAPPVRPVQPWTGVDPALATTPAGSPPITRVDPAFYQAGNADTPQRRSLVPADLTPQQNAAPLSQASGTGPLSGAMPPASPAPAANRGPEIDQFQEASKAAARMGMGMGPGSMFPVFNNQTAPIQQPGTNSFGNGNPLPEPQRMLPTDLPPQDLRGAFRPDPPLLQSPSEWQGGRMPPATRPMYSVEQFGTASRYDTRTIESSGTPQPMFTDPGLKRFEDERWEAGRVLNNSFERVWAQAPVNSPVSPASGSQYSRPETPGLNYTQTENGSTLHPPSWPFARQAEQFAMNPNGTSQAGQPLTPDLNPIYPANVVVPEPYRPQDRPQPTAPQAATPAAATQPPQMTQQMPQQSAAPQYPRPQMPIQQTAGTTNAAPASLPSDYSGMPMIRPAPR
ncbi:tetratricopeptide repeat protein [Planctomicrobium sp. SH664]|uniref:tetratricopeptide repeat protein n=1 Tax=Planctomicrobium sp. SH664 TaxID=3448125 RepID=UPI003F5CB015